MSQISKVKVETQVRDNHWAIPTSFGIMFAILLYSISSVETELTETREHRLQSDVFIRKLFLIILAQKVWKSKDSDLVVMRILIGNLTMSSKAKYVYA